MEKSQAGREAKKVKYNQRIKAENMQKLYKYIHSKKSKNENTK